MVPLSSGPFKSHSTFQLIHSFDTESSVFALAYFDSFLYLGLTEGQVGLYDMDTRQIVRVDKVSDDDDVMTMALYGDCLFRGGRATVFQGYNGVILIFTMLLFPSLTTLTLVFLVTVHPPNLLVLSENGILNSMFVLSGSPTRG